MSYLHPKTYFRNQNNRSNDSIQAARAELIGSDRCSALGITARGTTPVLALCRRLVEAGHDPATPLEVWRGTTLCLRVRSIGEAAQFTIEDDRHGRPRLRRWRDRAKGCGAAPLVRQIRDTATTAPPCVSAHGCER
jgi:hypothetical protein